MNRISPAARQVAHSLTSASDAALGRVVQLVDTMASRTEIDSVLDSVRPRLRSLRPARPISVNRLLFMPLEGVMVAPAAWRRDSGHLPRNALAALAAVFNGNAARLTEESAAACHGHTFDQTAEVGQIGRQIWQAAAKAMPPTPPAGWQSATGLRPEDYEPLVALCSGVWRHAGRLWDVIESDGDTLSEAMISAALAGPAQDPEEVFAASLALLLERLPRPGFIASVAAGLDPRARVVASRALDRMIDAELPPLDPTDPAGAAARVEQLADRLADLEASTLGTVPDRRDRLQKLRHQADLACREAFVATLGSGLLTPLIAMADTAEEAEVTALEAQVRDLRRLLLACQRVSTTDSYERASRTAIGQLMERGAKLASLDRAGPGATGPRTPDKGVTLVDLARMVEILGGRQAADRMLAQSRR